MIIIVMGVTGSGKTTLGKAIAQELKLPFYDADDFHPAANREKLRNNIPLDDEDRLPWLEVLSKRISEWKDTGGAVLACSALKESYRKILASASCNVAWIYLKGDKELIAARLAARASHGHDLIGAFGRILDGQYKDLEEPKHATVVRAELPLPEAVKVACAGLDRTKD